MRLPGRACLALMGMALSASVANAASGKLHVNSVDGFGKPVAAEISVYSLDGKQLGHSVGESADFELERGTYRVSVEERFRIPEFREVSLTGSKLNVAIASQWLSPIDDGPPDEGSTVTVWVKRTRECAEGALLAGLTGVYWKRSAKLWVNQNGYATFESWEPGRYRLTVTDAIGRRTTKEFRLDKKIVVIPLETTEDCQIR